MDRVLQLSDKLRAEGIDCHIDQYEISPPNGWPRWMMDQIEESDFVLVACTEQYNRRFRGKESDGRGRGARWEGAIITQEIYGSESSNNKFIPILFSPDDDAHIPIPLRGSTYYDISSEEGYESLYRHLTHQPRIVKPDLGKLRSLPPLQRKQNFESLHKTANSLFLNRRTITVTNFAGRMLRHWTAIVVAVLLIIAIVGTWTLWTRSNSYQIRAVLQEGSQLANASEESAVTNWVGALVKAGHIDKAIETANRSPSQDACYTTIISVLIDLGKIDEAITIANKMKDEEIQGSPYSTIVGALIRANKTDDVLTIVHKIESPLAMNLAMVTRALANRNRTEDAKRLIEQSLNEVNKRKTDPFQYDSYSEIADALVGIGEVKEAEKIINQAISLAVKSGGGSTHSSFVSRVVRVLVKLDKTKRVNSFVKEIEEYPGEPYLYITVAEALAHSGTVVEARGFADKALTSLASRDSSDSQSLFLSMLVTAYAKIGEIDKSISVLRMIDFPSFDYITHFISLGEVLAKAGKLDEVINSLRRFENQYLEYTILIGIANALIRSQKLEEARKATEQAFVAVSSGKSQENQVNAYVTVANTFVKTGRTDDAKRILEEATTLAGKLKVPFSQSKAYVEIADSLISINIVNEAERLAESSLTIAEQIAQEKPRSIAFRGIAKIQAKLKNFYHAHKTASLCLHPEEKLDIYSSILIEYAKGHH